MAYFVSLGICLIFIFVYRRVNNSLSYFTRQQIPGPKPIPLFGNTWGIWKEVIPDHDKRLVRKHGKVFGYYDGMNPNLWITDTSLIKQIFVKDFDHFVNRRNFAFGSKIIRKMVSLIRNDDWRHIRSSITPVFTKSKIKRMSMTIKQCAESLVSRLEVIAENQGKFDLKELFNVFTLDVIARCAFGMAVDHSVTIDKQAFVKNAKTIFNLPVNRTPLAVIPTMFPSLVPIFGDRFFLTDAFQYFVEILTSLMKERSSSGKEFHDFIEFAKESVTSYNDSMGNGRKQTKWTAEEMEEIVIAQGTLLLLAGFDTTATALANVVFMLTINPDVQERLYQMVLDIEKQPKELGDEIITEELPYMDQVITEALRIYPPVPRVERECNQDISYEGIHIKKGMMVTVPTFALHFDEDYYESPELFKPDRWNSENKPSRDPYAYMPFGMGPRNCIGMRFANEEIKIALTNMLCKFEFIPVKETPERIQFEPGYYPVAQPRNLIVGIKSRLL